MARAWHKKREQLAPIGTAGVTCWRATRYKLNDRSGRKVIEASPGARWRRFSPFDSYKSTSRAREVEAGPHLTFLNLRGLLEEKSNLWTYALVVFSENYGLLGALEEDYELQRPIYPYGKGFVAPEAVIDDQGRVRRVDPATEGKGLLRDLLWSRRKYRVYKATSWGTEYDPIALPSEIGFSRKMPGHDSEGRPVPERRQPSSWKELKEDFGVLVVLDRKADKGISILCTREPVRRWESILKSFPPGHTPTETLASVASNSFNAYLREVSPRVYVGEDGTLKQGWDYRTLLHAMRIMLYLDLTGGSTVKRCQSRGCPNYFRRGSQGTSVYCSSRCASRASTRIGRGQVP